MHEKTIIFFSRSELTFLYGSVHKYLKNEFNILHVAYSEYEGNILTSEFNISDVVIFKDVAESFIEYTPNQNDLEQIDELLLGTSDGNFNLNSMLQSNRTSPYIGYNNAIHAANVYYKAWSHIFNNRKVDFFVHEPVSLMINQMAEAICSNQGGIYTTHILVQGDNGGHNFIMVDHYNGVPSEIIRRYNEVVPEFLVEQKQRIISFLNKFRSTYDVFFNALGGGESNFKLKFQLRKAVLRQKIKNILNPDHYDPILDNIELFINNDNLSSRRIKNISSYDDINYDAFDPSIPYYFYPLHLEPEAVVLYWADGLYTNQVKLIENIAAQLPPGVFLYVKDHPHLHGYREKIDYVRIQNVPNVKLIKTSISGKQIIKDCIGVITINGTGGFEALLMNKQVITFGSAFYSASKRVKYVNNVKDLRVKLYGLRGVNYNDDDDLRRFVLAYLNSQKQGFTDFYAGMHKALNIDLDENGFQVAKGLKEYFIEHTMKGQLD